MEELYILPRRTATERRITRRRLQREMRAEILEARVTVRA